MIHKNNKQVKPGLSLVFTLHLNVIQTEKLFTFNGICSRHFYAFLLLEVSSNN